MTDPCDKEFPRTFLPDELDLGDWQAVQPWVEKLLERQLTSADDLEQWLLDLSELQSCVSEERARHYIAMTCDTEDEDAESRYLHLVEHFMPAAKPWFHKLNEYYVASPFRTELDASRYAVLDRGTAMDIELYRQKNIELQTQASILSQRYQKISGVMTVEFLGKERTMPQMGKFLEEIDRGVRQQAWEAIWDRRLQDRDACDEIFDELVELRHQIALNADCSNYRDYTFKSYHRFDYTPESCEQFHDAVERNVMPLVRTLADQRCAALGLDHLRPWDFGVDPQGRSPLRPFEDGSELGQGARRIFARLDPELEAQFVSMLEGGELDLESRKGKAPGGYQSSLEEVRRPFIFMNAAGLHRDVETLLHESGHAFHALAARHEPLLDYRHAPIEFAEVASMTMELFGDDYLDEFYSREDAARAKRKHLEGIIELLPWIARIDAFQHWIYKNPQHTHDERTMAWIQLGERFEAPIEWSGHTEARHAGWQRQLHIFCYPFYYIEYGIAQLGALQIWDTFKRDSARGLAAYRSALALGGSLPLPTLFKAAGARLAFDESIIAPLMERVGEELAKLPA